MISILISVISVSFSCRFSIYSFTSFRYLSSVIILLSSAILLLSSAILLLSSAILLILPTISAVCLGVLMTRACYWLLISIIITSGCIVGGFIISWLSCNSLRWNVIIMIDKATCCGSFMYDTVCCRLKQNISPHNTAIKSLQLHINSLPNIVYQTIFRSTIYQTSIIT